MEQEIFYLDTGNDRIYFNVIDGTIVCHDKTSAVPYEKLITFLQTAKELGMKVGKI